MFNTLIVAAVTDFSGTPTPDKNGKMPVMLQCIAGTMPNRNVLSGTVAERNGVQVGKTYLFQVRERGVDDQFGADFTFVKVAELTTALDIVKTCNEIGSPVITQVARPAGFKETYQRKSVAIESLQARRIKAGLYHPSLPTSIANHENAAGEVKGRSLEAVEEGLRDLPADFYTNETERGKGTQGQTEKSGQAAGQQ